MLHVGYEKIVSRHYRRHLAEAEAGQTLCGLSVEGLVHPHPLLDPSGFLALGFDAEPCRKCTVKATVEAERHGRASQWSPAAASS